MHNSTAARAPHHRLALLSSFFIIAALSGPAVAAVENNSDTEVKETRKAATQKAPASEDKLICKREKVLGSNMRKRVCYRKKDVEERRRADNEEVRRYRTQTPQPTVSD